MPGLGLAAPRPTPAPWPANAIFGIDFLTSRAMRDGVYIPLDQAMSFSRPSPRLAKTASGAWRAFAPNEPAITDLGLSLEPEATNLIVNNTGNSGSGILLTGTTMAPIGGNDSPARDAHGKRVTQGAGASDGLTRHSINTIGGKLYSWSQSFKYDGSATWIRFTFSDNVAHGVNAWLNLQTMTLGTTGAFGTAVLQSCTLTPEIDGWHRLAMTGSVPNNATGGLSTYVAASNGGSTRVAGTCAIWGTQMELGGLTSAVATQGTATTRLADTASVLLNAANQKLHVTGGDVVLGEYSTAGGSVELASQLHQVASLWTLAL